jgi:3-carboxy-cis,cis-muconate cycloisomerase
MPHKNNPVLSESLVVLARQNAHFAGLQLQSLVHGNERDATAWMLEWENLPRMMTNTGTALHHALSITQTMGVNEEVMKQNMNHKP